MFKNNRPPYLSKSLQGYKVVYLVSEPSDRLVAILRTKDEYIVALNYSPEDGDWGQGRYGAESLADARRILQEYSPINFRVTGLSYKIIPAYEEGEYRLVRIPKGSPSNGWSIFIGTKDECKAYAKNNDIQVALL